MKVTLQKIGSLPNANNAQLEIYPIGMTKRGFISKYNLPKEGMMFYMQIGEKAMFNTSEVREIISSSEKEIHFKTKNSEYLLTLLS